MGVPGSLEKSEADFGSTVHRLVKRVSGNSTVEVYDDLADEVPVALEYNGISHAVMLATPAALEQFAIGFSLSEGIVGALGDIFEVEVEQGGAGITVHLRIEGAAFMKLKERRRNLTGRTGCGLCGTEDLGQVMRPLARLPARALAASSVHRALAGLKQFQPLSGLTGATHAAAWSDSTGNVIAAYEDVGRHNALDKLIGALVRNDAGAEDGFIVITSRCSFEMIAKAAVFGASTLVALSAPTSLAIERAQACGVTLIAIARPDRAMSFAGPDSAAGGGLAA